MSSSDQKESRTIRVSGETYSQLAVLAGFWSAIKGEPQSISELSDLILSEYYDKSYPSMLSIVSNPEKLQKARKLGEDTKKQMTDVFNSMKIKE
ncbi:MAG TPA: hypothetical protein VIE86_05250 [Nitrososphaera sp.]|jgi:type VI protein secretion system component Hcp